MLFDRGGIKVDIYINYGKDTIVHHTVKTCSEANVLDVLKDAAEIELTEDESATGHEGAMVTSIDGIKNNADHCWIYYVFELGSSGWRIPVVMPDKLEVSDKMRIGWRYYDFAKRGSEIKDGPRWTSRCVSKTRTCARQFS